MIPSSHSHSLFCHIVESLAVWDVTFAFLCNDISCFRALMLVILPCEELSPISHFIPPRRQRCVQNDHMVCSPRIEATQICLQTNKSVCTPTLLRRHNTLVFVLLSQIEPAHMKIIQVSSLFFLSARGGYIEVTSSILSHGIFCFDNLQTAGKTTASMRARVIYIYIYISLVLRNSHAIKQFQRTTGTLVSTAEASFFFFFMF